MTDSQLQRLNMVESQVRPSDVTDRRIIQAMLEVPREAFVPAALASMAYRDEAVPAAARANAGEARYLLPPRTFAKLVQLADIGPQCVVLDVGCASGYSTAVLAKLAARVVGVECDRALAASAAEVLRKLGLANVQVIEGPLAAGAPAQGPYDAVLLNGAVPEIAPALRQQLKDGGRLVAVVTEGPLCRAQVWRRTGKAFDARSAFDAPAEPLPGFERKAGFLF